MLRVLARASGRIAAARHAAGRPAVIAATDVPTARRWSSAQASPDREGKEKLVIFDTTLRDGEQSPGVTLTQAEKLIIAMQLSKLGVTVCEAGFPIASEGDFEAVTQIAREVGSMTEGRIDGIPMTICGLARAREQDIERCVAAVEHAPKHRVHTFLATSDIHLEHKLQITREEALRQIADKVSFARGLCDDIEFSPEDAGRSDVHFLVEALQVAIENGASTLNIPDTVGYNLPEQYGSRLRFLIENTKGADSVVWSTHCHNDLGLATANTLAGIVAGARQAEVTVNGVGERAGNTSLEEVVMSLYVHQAELPVYCDVDTRQITDASKAVSLHTGMLVQPNKAIVGENAFSHESGIHQDGVLKHQATYEIIRPEVVGLDKHDGMVLGKLSGRAGFKTRLESLDYTQLTDGQFKEAFESFKRLADTKRSITDGDLHALIRDVLKAEHPTESWQLKQLTVTSTSNHEATATMTVNTPDGEDICVAEVAAGPISAIYRAVDRIITFPVHLKDYRIGAVGAGKDALGEVTVSVASSADDVSAQVFSGVGYDPDVLAASAKAYLNAVNSIYTALHSAESKARVTSQGDSAAI